MVVPSINAEEAVASKKSKKRQESPSRQKTKLEKLGLVDSGRSLGEIRKAMKVGRQHAERGEWADAVKHLLIAWDAMPEDLAILTILSHALVQLGVREHAIHVLQRALEFHEPNAELISVMLTLSLEMGMFDVAHKLGQQLILLEPNNPTHYVNLATAYSGLNKYDESIAMLQQTLPLFPESSDLWNVLATQVRERNGVDAADIFFEEALRLNPTDPKILSNYSISFVQRGMFDKALELSMRAVEIQPEQSEPNISIGQINFLKGDLKTGWKAYEHRLDARRKQNQTQIYTHGVETWEGQDLGGKTLFVTSEQGIGDEVMFGNFLPFLYERAEKLVIGCDRRLVSLYQRRFPDATVDFHIDQFQQGYRYRYFPHVQKAMKEGELKIDYAIPVASSAKFDWVATSEIKAHSAGFLKPDPEREAEFRKQMGAISNKPKVGLAWRSGIITQQRAYLYSPLESLSPLLAHADKVDFINLQYGEVTAELQQIKELHGVDVHVLEGVDLKADIEANIAIAANCDMVVSSNSAPGMFALSSGRPTIATSPVLPWWCFGTDGRVPFAAEAECVVGKETVDWAEIMQRVADKVAARLVL